MNNITQMSWEKSCEQSTHELIDRVGREYDLLIKLIKANEPYHAYAEKIIEEHKTAMAASDEYYKWRVEKHLKCVQIDNTSERAIRRNARFQQYVEHHELIREIQMISLDRINKALF